jgi:hypothetical protein
MDVWQKKVKGEKKYIDKRITERKGRRRQKKGKRQARRGNRN